MSKHAFIFPGQGSQKVGMGKNHYENNAAFKEFADEADRILGYSITNIMFDGPEESLKQTKYTQPAIFLHSFALFRTLNAKPDMVAGHSLGEFSALAAAGSIAFDDALLIVSTRGKLMQQAGTTNPGTMAAVIGMKDEEVEEICKQATVGMDDIVVPANYNSTGQLVISGHETAVDRALTMLKERGCKLAKKLPVSGAFHSTLMQPALEGLRMHLEALNINEPDCPVYANYSAKPSVNPDKIRNNLLHQLLNPVLWTQTMQNMQADGAVKFTEVGPGNVLQGLVKRTLTNIETEGYQ
jgi:[acyl-carrier-protein] S-malonyltransferase